MPVPPLPPPVQIQIGKQGMLFSLIGANMNTTADQDLVKSFNFTAFLIDKIVVTNASTSLTLAVGGFYGAAAKGSPILVAASQIYAGLTTSDIILNPTLTAAAQRRLTLASIVLSLTTVQGATATADVYVLGTALS